MDGIESVLGEFAREHSSLRRDFNKSRSVPAVSLKDNGWSHFWLDCTYVSANTFTVNYDVTGIFRNGCKLYLHNTTAKYFTVVESTVSAGVTTVIVNGHGVYTLAAVAISMVYYSYMVYPQGWPYEGMPSPLSTWLSMPLCLACWNMSSVDEALRIMDASGQGRSLETMNYYTPATGIQPYISLTAARWLFRSVESLGNGVGWSGAGANLTVAIWVRPQQAVAALHYYISRLYTAPANQRAWRIICTAGGFPSAFVSLNGTAALPNYQDVISPKTMVQGQWSFICMRFIPNTELALFHNMEKTISANAPIASIFSNHAKLVINGASWGSSTGIFDVGLTAMYRAALDDNAVYQLFQSSRGWYGV